LSNREDVFGLRPGNVWKSSKDVEFTTFATNLQLKASFFD